MMPSALPQRISVGAAMRCARLAKPRSAIGQTNLPEQACAQMNCASVSTLGRIARDVEEAPRRLPFGIGKERGPARLVAEDHPVFDRQVVPPQADRIDQHHAADRLRRRRRKLGGNEGAEGMADKRRR